MEGKKVTPTSVCGCKEVEVDLGSLGSSEIARLKGVNFDKAIRDSPWDK